LSTAVAFIGLFSLGLALFSGWALLSVLLAILLLIWLNWPFYQFLQDKRGLRFALMALPWHWLYFIYSGATFLVGVLLYRLGRVEQIVAEGLRPLATPPPIKKPRPTID
jgi:hypothetical protein